MGDMTELITYPSYQNKFYKTSGSGLLFEVKSPGNAAIGLAEKPGTSCDVWVVIGHLNELTWIKKQDGSGQQAKTLEILDNEEYRRFWLSWRNGFVQLGRDGDNTPIVSYEYKGYLQYSTFSSLVGNTNDPVHWRIELPPTCILEKPKTKPITNGELIWVPRTDKQPVPDGALIGGYEKETLYIMRAPHRGSMTPGKLVPSKRVGYIAWGSDAHEKQEFEVLCGFDCTWVPSHEHIIPIGAVDGGYVENSREKLYVGRALHHGHLIPGKVAPSHKVCYIPYEGKEIAHKEYEILVSPNYSDAHSVTSTFVQPINVGGPPSPENYAYGAFNNEWLFENDDEQDYEHDDEQEDIYPDHEDAYLDYDPEYVNSDDNHDDILTDDDREDVDDHESIDSHDGQEADNEDLYSNQEHEYFSADDVQDDGQDDHEYFYPDENHESVCSEDGHTI